MPDKTKQSVSASQMGALFGVSPWCTPWMLYEDFKNGISSEPAEEHSRMYWGKVLEPHILEKAASDLNIEVKRHDQEVYRRHGNIGATIDAEIFDPQRGPGSLEVKCVFDYAVWMQKWNGGDNPPKQYELQLATQVLVGDGEKPYRWGVLAAWVCGDMYYWERELHPALAKQILEKAEAFLLDVQRGNEPDPFGQPIEAPILRELFPLIEKTYLDSDDVALEEKARLYAWADREAKTNKKTADSLKVTLLHALGENKGIRFPGTILEQQKVGAHGRTLKVTELAQRREVADNPHDFPFA